MSKRKIQKGIRIYEKRMVKIRKELYEAGYKQPVTAEMLFLTLTLSCTVASGVGEPLASYTYHIGVNDNNIIVNVEHDCGDIHHSVVFDFKATDYKEALRLVVDGTEIPKGSIEITLKGHKEVISPAQMNMVIKTLSRNAYEGLLLRIGVTEKTKRPPSPTHEVVSHADNLVQLQKYAKTIYPNTTFKIEVITDGTST